MHVGWRRSYMPLSLHVIFCDRALEWVAFWREMSYDLRHAVGSWPPFEQGECCVSWHMSYGMLCVFTTRKQRKCVRVYYYYVCIIMTYYVHVMMCVIWCVWYVVCNIMCAMMRVFWHISFSMLRVFATCKQAKCARVYWMSIVQIVHVHLMSCSDCVCLYPWKSFADCVRVLDILCRMCVCIGCFVRIVRVCCMFCADCDLSASEVCACVLDVVRIVHVCWMSCADCACVLDVLCGMCVCIGSSVRIVRVCWMFCADCDLWESEVCACLLDALCGLDCAKYSSAWSIPRVQRFFQTIYGFL